MCTDSHHKFHSNTLQMHDDMVAVVVYRLQSLSEGAWLTTVYL